MLDKNKTEGIKASLTINLGLIKRLCIIMVTALVVGSLLMILAYKIPSENIAANIKKDSLVIDSYFRQTYNNTDWQGYILDDYTDSIMLSMTFLYQNHLSPITQAFDNLFIGNPEATVKGEGTARLFADLVMNQSDTIPTDSYARYWHGYVFFLRCLLTFLSFSQIQFLGIGVVVSLFVFIAWKCKEAKKANVILPFSIALFSLGLQSMVLSLHFIQDCLILLIAIALYLQFKEFLQKHIPEILFLCGISAAYLDFLAFPLITYGFPIIFIILTTDHFTIQDFIITSLCWVIGYGGFWAMKWILSSLILQRNLLFEAAQSVQERTSTTGDNRWLGYLDCLRVNLALLQPAILPSFVWLSGIFSFSIFKKKHGDQQKISMLILTGLVPFVWAFFMQNHCQVHYWFTFRIFSVFLFAMCCIPLCYKHDSL